MAEESSKRKRGRRKGQTKHPVHELFEYDEDLDESRCTVGTCNKKIPKNHAGNLMSHLEAHHKEVHANTSAKADEVFGRPDRNAPKRAKRTVLNGVKMSGPALELHSLRLITEGGLSFKALDYPAFKDIIQPMIDAMPRADQPTISSDTTPQRINGFAERVGQKMIQEMEDKMVSVKVDGCTKSTRHFIGVNVQYVHEGKTVVRTLAVEELFISSTGTNLKAIITRILRKYGIPVKAVVSFTSDNGANYILAGKLLGLDEAEEMMAEFEEPLESWAEGVELTQDDFHLQSVRCAEHTLQLAVDDACKSDEEFRPLLTSVKKLCNFLRTESMARQIKDAGLPLPTISVITRWGSDYDMLKSVYNLKNFMDFTLDCTASDRQRNFLSEDQWKKVETLLADLRPARKATTRLQAKDITLGDFFAIWTELTYSLRSRKTPLADKLIKAMDEKAKAVQYRQRGRGERLPPLFHYPSFNAAVFLDPRFVALLSPDQISDAKSYLLELWLRVQRRRGVQFEEADAEDEENPDEPMAMALDDSEDEGVVDFKRFLERQNHTRLTRGGPANAPSSWSWKEKLRAKLDDYDRVVKPLPVTANVITYWEGKKLIWPELAELALIVLSIPATQVSVERLFSSLRFILRPQRHHLSAGNIDDVILLHTNPDIVKKLCEELQMLQTSSSGSNSTEDNSMQDTQETRSRSSSSSSLLSP